MVHRGQILSRIPRCFCQHINEARAFRCAFVVFSYALSSPLLLCILCCQVEGNESRINWHNAQANRIKDHETRQQPNQGSGERVLVMSGIRQTLVFSVTTASFLARFSLALPERTGMASKFFPKWLG